MIRSGPVWAWSAMAMAATFGSMLAPGVMHGREDISQRQQLGSVALAAPDTLRQEDSVDPVRQNLEPSRQVREGSTLKNDLGTFQIVGDRVTFSPADGRAPMAVLENLALERVWRMLEVVGSRQWRVSGTVTEYRGRNFLLLERAVVRTGTERPPAKPKVVEPHG